jgi:hypothetical protein
MRRMADWVRPKLNLSIITGDHGGVAA